MSLLSRSAPGGRLLLVLGSFIAAFLLILARLYVLQILQAPLFTRLAHRQYTTTVTLPAQRGTIFDRNQQPLALSCQKLSAFIDRNTVSDQKEAEQFLKDHFPLVHQQWLSCPHQSFFWLARHISQQRKERIANLYKHALFMFEPSRWYLYPYVPEVTGFTNIDTKGMSGIERAADQTLAGRPTTMRCQKEARNTGLYFVEHVITPGSSGHNLSTTIDQQLHFLIQEELAKTVKKADAVRACAVVMDPTNGQILTLAQAPSYDPNNPAAATADIRKNHLVGSCHELGSVMSIFSFLAALAEGTTTPDELVNCEGRSTHIDGFKIENEQSIGTIPLWQVFTKASNVGTAKVCKRLGTLLYEHYSRLGFGVPTGICLAGERSGFVNPPERWSASSPLQLSYGYDVMATMIQVAKALSVLASNGTAIIPTLRMHQRAKRGLQLYDHEPIAHMRDMMKRATQHYKICLPTYTVMSKAGMAYILNNGTYDKKSCLYSCAGIIEKNDYKRVIFVLIQKPKKRPCLSYQLAAPLFERVATITALHEQECPPPAQT